MTLAEHHFDDREADSAVRAALLAERSAYDTMRRLVPDLDLPANLRRPLSVEQRCAVDRYQLLRESLESLRGAHRKLPPAELTLVRD